MSRRQDRPDASGSRGGGMDDGGAHPVPLYDVHMQAPAVPETVAWPHFDFTSFRVHGQISLGAPPDGDCLHCFVDEQGLALHPQFVEKLDWDRKIAGIRLKLARAASVVAPIPIRKARECKAPKSLLKAAGARA